ncbi:hypothetical protein L1283_003765 [Sphingobacterium sp. HSC-15S19]
MRKIILITILSFTMLQYTVFQKGQRNVKERIQYIFSEL